MCPKVKCGRIRTSEAELETPSNNFDTQARDTKMTHTILEIAVGFIVALLTAATITINTMPADETQIEFREYTTVVESNGSSCTQLGYLPASLPQCGE